jgi:hypothetical protein
MQMGARPAPLQNAVTMVTTLETESLAKIETTANNPLASSNVHTYNL